MCVNYTSLATATSRQDRVGESRNAISCKDTYNNCKSYVHVDVQGTLAGTCTCTQHTPAAKMYTSYMDVVVRVHVHLKFYVAFIRIKQSVNI